MANPVPTPQLAGEIVAHHFGWHPLSVRRFTTGLAFFVFDVVGETDNVVVRLGLPEQAAALADAETLARQLRPLGVPLPQTLASGTAQGCPYVILSRLPGTDLGNVMHDLCPASLDRIAASVAAAQRATMQLGTGTGFGYAPSADRAPHRRWTDVVIAHLDRSERRIAANGLFAFDAVTEVRTLLARHTSALDQVPATPFLHDTTTKNVIVAADGTLSGIVDVDDLCFGDPRYTPALTHVAMLVHGGPTEYVERWMHHAGFADDALFRLYVLLFLLDFMSEHGTSFNGNEAVSALEDRQRLSALFGQSLPAAQ